MRRKTCINAERFYKDAGAVYSPERWRITVNRVSGGGARYEVQEHVADARQPSGGHFRDVVAGSASSPALAKRKAERWLMRVFPNTRAESPWGCYD